ncbi:sigma-70 family RNA polymerase sigma factor [Dapis sp. BLCC M229]|uniref:sigma-70 family RNA polymerase sigma factor n=1 Tax=Dapis sp. BLCC M229 TaxID=3400188 RepID=UPI003CF1FE1B
MKTSFPTPSVDLDTNVHLGEIDRNINIMLESRNFLPSIDYKLMQFGLNFDYDEMDVVLNARDIAIKKIESGEKVEYYKSWFRSICFNVIKNFSKSTKSRKLLVYKLKSLSCLSDSREDLIPEYTTEPNLKLLGKGWKGLNEKEKAILWLREIEEHSWSEVAEKLVIKGLEVDGDRKKLEDRVRQKGNRALKKLQKHFGISK